MCVRDVYEEQNVTVTALLGSTWFRSFSITAQYFISPSQHGRGGHSTSALVSLSFFDAFISSKRIHLHLDYRPRCGFQHSNLLTRERITTISVQVSGQS